MNFGDLEISLQRRSEERYGVELRFSQPQSDTDIRLAGPDKIVSFDFARLREAELEPAAYGRALADQLFAAPGLRAAFAQARGTATALDLPLRMRLFLDAGAPELHALRWEVLQDPEADRPLLTDERLLFSRYLASVDWRPVRLRPRSALRALIAVAAPTDLARFQLAPIDAAAELERARQGFGDLPADTTSATLTGLAEQLRAGYDILYLVCHGALVDGIPWLWLEDETGATARVAGSEFAQRVRELDQRPRLVVLASCESAAPGDGPALASLGPLLAEAGVPAVVAMQGMISMATVATFTPTFFREFQRDGQIDRALAVARGAIRARPDSWMPTLFLRLRSGRIWYVPGFADEHQAFEKWPVIVRGLREGHCTPILGFDLAERTLGSLRDLATRWADSYAYPLAPHEREAIHAVAQYLSVQQSPGFPRDELRDYVRHTLANRFADDLSAGAEAADIYDLLAVAGEIQRERNPHDPYKVLAEQPLPIYVTTAQHSLLTEALRASGKEPVVEFCRWTPALEKLPSIYKEEPRYLPSAARPLVFHVFGVLAEPDSLVLAEDDYFDYLLRVSRVPDLIPLAVREALTDTALLFLGFRIDGWDFRVLYRSLLQQEGRARRSKYAHVAGQVSPDEDYFLRPTQAQRYFERYFAYSDISLYWGSVDDFAHELHDQLAAVPSLPPPPPRESLRRR